MKAQQIFGSPGTPAARYDGWSTHSLHIPMRDGVKLAVDIVLPKGLAPEARLPALVSQTRYWRSPELRAPFKWFVEPSSLNAYVKDLIPFFTSQGYALVMLDVRGTGASYGEWPHPWPDRSTHDVHDLAEWIVSQPWSNGRIGGYGVSYLGTTAELMAVPRHPAIRAVVPMFNHPDAYQDIGLPGGIFHQRFIEAWGNFDHNLDNNIVPREFGAIGRLMMKGVKPIDGAGSRALLREAVSDHVNNGHAYRLGRELTFRDEAAAGKKMTVDDTTVARYRKEITESHTVSFGWGSWMDAGTADAVIRRFLSFDNAMRAAIGTWEHGGRFHASPYQAPDATPCPGLPGQYEEMLRFFDAQLKDADNGVADERVLFYYTMGEERWHRTPCWPPEDAKRLASYLTVEGKGLHDLMCDWVWDLLTRIVESHGEEEMHRILRASQDTWMMKRTWKAFLRMSVEDRVRLTAEIARVHRCGPRQDGTVEIVEEEDCFTIRMDPCGSGGRMRRGDPVDGTPSRLGPPYHFGATRTAHALSWGRAGVPYYCLHCALNELLPMEWGGHPLWVTEYEDDASKPCAWHFYKRAELIPDEVYERVGRKKPDDGEGRY